jgi:hypothetical protein
VHTCIEFRKISEKPIYLCWWARFKSPNKKIQWHPDSSKTEVTPEMYIAAWDSYVAGYIPMVYWFFNPDTDPEGVNAAVTYLEQCVKQYRELTDKPIIPTGRAYNGDGSDGNDIVYPAAMRAFAKRAMDLGCVGLSWWDAEHSIKLDEIWMTVAEIYSELAEDPSPFLPLEEEGIDISGDAIQGSGTWKTVRENHLNLRLSPAGIRGNERGGLMAGDEIEVLPGRTIFDGIPYVPIVIYVAEEYLK